MVMVNLALYWASGASGTLVSGDIAARCLRWRCGIIASGCSRSSTFAMASSILRRSRERQRLRRGWGVCWWGCCWRVVCCCWGAAGVVAVPAAGVFVGQLGLPGLRRLGMERYPATPEPPPIWFGLPDT